MRCDVNVSVRPKGEQRLRTRVEIKNMNSLTSMQKAIEYEFNRQVLPAAHQPPAFSLALMQPGLLVVVPGDADLQNPAVVVKSLRNMGSRLAGGAVHLHSVPA